MTGLDLMDVQNLFGPKGHPNFTQSDTAPRSLDPRVGVRNSTLTNNPLNLLGPNKSPNHFEPDYRVPTVNAVVGNSPTPNSNVLGLTWPIPPYRQPGT
jgi:hypothetical protein